MYICVLCMWVYFRYEQTLCTVYVFISVYGDTIDVHHGVYSGTCVNGHLRRAVTLHKAVSTESPNGIFHALHTH